MFMVRPACGLRVVGRRVVLTTLALVDLAMSPKVGDNRKVATTSLYFACKCCDIISVVSVQNESRILTLLSRVTVHVSLQ